ncbi:HAD family hydrolase [Evansella tamaricis]|uniref:HAD family hydrolase n=1 Tax=Evansella tamaricis TaxID=2069301 RepID=A0ABS6JD89_9BACI|nr:HAD family hydrolase [Evansella tamaricis]MBU9710405.1 HAD family hydrolase [Evansella tamaricis]
MSNYKILFLDIDGTILRPDDTIENSTKEAIQQVQEKGMDVFLATGRPLHEIMEIGEELNINSYIGYNGAFAKDNGEIVFREPISKDAIQHFLNVSKEKGHDFVMYNTSQNFWNTLDSKYVKEFIDKFQLKCNEIFAEEYKEEILGVTLFNVKKEEVELYESIDDVYLTTVNVEGIKNHAYDVIRNTVNKGYAVKKVLERKGYKTEQAIAFGDGMNDKEMLHVAGVGFAMGNALPGLLEFADRKTTSVMDSGVYNGLKILGLVK